MIRFLFPKDLSGCWVESKMARVESKMARAEAGGQ